MRAIRRLALCAAVSLTVAGLAAPGAQAQEYPTPSTPIPVPRDPEQPPASQPTPAPGPVVADAGTLIGVVRVLPGTVPPGSKFDDPEYDDQLPKQAVAEFGLGRAIAQANSTAYFAQERAIAETSPVGVALFGQMPQLPAPGVLAQTALPDHPEPETSGLRTPPETDKGLRLSGLTGSVHARWDEQLGPCVQPISDANLSLGSISAVNSLPTAGTLNGLLDGGTPPDDGKGSLLHVPDALQAHSKIELVDVPGQQNKAVQATSKLQLASVQLFANTPQEIRIEVVSAPTLTATATGDPETSTVEYTAPVLRVFHGDEEVGTLDAAHPFMDLPFGGDGPLPALDLGIIRLSIGELEKQIDGTDVRGTARLFDLKLLNGEHLGIPTSLVEMTFGEQVAHALAPEGGVDCRQDGTPAANPDQATADPDDTVPAAAGELALTNGAYHAVPIFWTGTGLLLLGAVLLAATPRRRSGQRGTDQPR
jgi:hypothetical protein